MAAEDRLTRLLDPATLPALTGIDFIEVDPTQTLLDVHFLRVLNPAPVITAGQVSISSLTGSADVPPVAVDHVAPNGELLRVTVKAPGGFAPYVLTIQNPLVDKWFGHQTFSFKSVCTSEFDCATPPPACPPPDLVDFPVDYQARDFQSFRRALMDFASQRYPDWADRLEADTGVMVAEVLSAFGDEDSYHQDRIAREAFLDTAIERRSVRHHARLVDYDINDGLGATTWIDVTAGADGSIPSGHRVYSRLGDNDACFELGKGLSERFTNPPASYQVFAALSAPTAYVWDPGNTCLSRGATILWLAHDLSAVIQPLITGVGKQVLLSTNPVEREVTARNWLVRVIDAQPDSDALMGVALTRLTLDTPTPFDLDASTLTVHFNILPATAGQTSPTVAFATGTTTPAMQGADQAVVRDGPLLESLGARALVFLYTLPGSATDGVDLVRLGADAGSARPEIHLIELDTQDPANTIDVWNCVPALIGTPSAAPTDKSFTLDDGSWQRIVVYPVLGGVLAHADYAGSAGKTIRFGDGDFGMQADGRLFSVTYRLGHGAADNVAAATIVGFDAHPAIAAVNNPFAVSNGLDPEPLGTVRISAPEAFRAIQYRAVTEADYADAAQRLDWVQRAAARFRWTGSWITAFVTPDPVDTDTLSAANREDLQAQLDRFRQAGRPAYVSDPTYADLDLHIYICVAPGSYPAVVRRAVIAAVAGSDSAFFAPQSFTFGVRLQRSALEATIQAVPGVQAVEDIQIRRRGYFDWQSLGWVLSVSDSELIRCDNDPLHPSRGSVDVFPEGGA
jgi:hypothetical protein